ncbi:hypothetical protein IE53DRAFT_95598 [Violaceomyces palustris]|uniref:Uncharacterized protein n=1 Tax=Violaceomyces palustris TaxID=1673888 RepID=A0ACD0P6T7_9BASI|nr:hypothetical protein IE53DRAFT_95598 [Violaceomyces palustris]
MNGRKEKSSPACFLPLLIVVRVRAREWRSTEALPRWQILPGRWLVGWLVGLFWGGRLSALLPLSPCLAPTSKRPTIRWGVHAFLNVGGKTNGTPITGFLLLLLLEAISQIDLGGSPCVRGEVPEPHRSTELPPRGMGSASPTTFFFLPCLFFASSFTCSRSRYTKVLPSDRSEPISPFPPAPSRFLCEFPRQTPQEYSQVQVGGRKGEELVSISSDF